MAEGEDLERRLERIEAAISALVQNQRALEDGIRSLAGVNAGSLPTMGEADERHADAPAERFHQLEIAFQQVARDVDAIIQTLVGAGPAQMLSRELKRRGSRSKYGYLDNLRPSLMERIARVEALVPDNPVEANRLADRMTAIEEESLLERVRYYEDTRALQESSALEGESVKRYLTADVFLDTDDDFKARELTTSLVDVLDALGFELVRSLPPQRGSFFQRFVLRSRETLSAPEVKERLAKVERALELQHLQARQAGIDVTLSKAVATLIEALSATKFGAIRAGSTLLIKRTNDDGETLIISQSLTPRQMIMLERDDAIRIFASASDIDSFMAALAEPTADMEEDPESDWS